MDVFQDEAVGPRWDDDAFEAPHRWFCERLAQDKSELSDVQVCKNAYYVLDADPFAQPPTTPLLRLGVRFWADGLAGETGSQGWGVSNDRLCSAKDAYVRSLSLEEIQSDKSCQPCQQCNATCVLYVNELRVMLMNQYTSGVLPLLRSMVQTVAHLKYTQQVALTSAIEKIRNEVIEGRILNPSPPVSVANPELVMAQIISQGIADIFISTIFSFSHSASASFNFLAKLPELAGKATAFDAIAASIRLVEKFVIPSIKLVTGGGGEGTSMRSPAFKPNLDSPLFETTKRVDSSYASVCLWAMHKVAQAKFGDRVCCSHVYL